MMLTPRVVALFAAAAPAALAARPSEGVELVNLNSPDTKWRLTNDPVMGGLSTSKITPHPAAGEVNFAGTVRIVPKLHAPGFCDAEAVSGLLTKFPDATNYDGIELVLRASGPLRSFKQSWGHHGTTNFGSYKAGFVLSDSNDWQTVFIPWDQYTNKWSDFTGECTDHGSICCSKLHPEVCPTEKAKASIATVGIWGEGAAGEFNLTIKSIRAAKAPPPAPPTCKSSEYCCPDAKHCLTPTTKTCGSGHPCSTGETCCPLTKLCVKVGAACTSPCTDPKSYCCPDAKKCLTPTNPGTLCDPSNKNSCKTGEICCPLIKECVTAGASCTPPADSMKPSWV